MDRVQTVKKDIQKQLDDKFVGKRFTIKEFEKALNFHFDLKGKNKLKVSKVERVLKINDFMLLFTIYPNFDFYFDVDVFYLKTNQKGVIYITEFNLECQET